MEGLQARSHVVAFRIRAHELVQPLQPVAHQLRLAQLLGHRRYPLVRCSELGIFSFHLHLLLGCGTFYAIIDAGLSGRSSPAGPARRGALYPSGAMIWITEDQRK